MTFAMSMNNLSIEGEFRYIIKWFNEWSELQRDDFIPVLVDCLNEDAKRSTVCMNGVVNAVANAGISDRPMSLFQCRIKLFREWSPKWPSELKHKLKDAIMEIDAKVGQKVLDVMKGEENDLMLNSPATVANANDLVDYDDVSVTLNVNVSAQDTAQNTENNLIDITADSITSAPVDDVDSAAAAVAVAETVNSLHEEPAEQLQIPLIQDLAVNNAEVSIAS